jgi:lipopolysaccharide biosynthesis glycosyltransferase
VNDGQDALVFAGDDRFAIGLAVALYSVLEHLARGFCPGIWVLDAGISAESRRRLAEIAGRFHRDVHWVTLSGERFAALPRLTPLSPANYGRLLIPEVLPTQVRRVVYLDSDILVRRDLSPLFSMSLGGTSLGAVRDFVIADTATAPSGVRDRSNPRPYFNSGVLVFDVPEWRRTRLGTRALEYVTMEGQPLRFGDQDALNALVRDWSALDDVWNAQVLKLTLAKRLIVTDRVEYRRQRSLFRSAAVYHFIGPKPWDPSCETHGTMAWVGALLRSRWFTPAAAAKWSIGWFARRALAWPRVAAGRWRKRVEILGASVRR